MSPLPATGALEPAEKARFVRLERTVERAVEVAGKIAGEALATIRDERLYRLTHHTFEAYVNERFGIHVRTAQRMIAAASGPDPVGELVEGSRQAVANPRPTTSAPGRPDSPFDMTEPEDEPEPPLAPDAGRLWAVVERVQPDRMVLVFDSEDYPGPGARVLVAWER